MLQEDSYAGKLYGNYRIIRRLARGGYGDVYLVEHTLLPRIAAIKFLHPELCGSGQKRQGFLQEAKLLETLKHPHILPIYDVGIGDEDYPPCLIVEYACGGSLLEMRRRTNGLLPVEQSLAILEQIAQALQHAHSHTPPIVHRDLKPDNILFNLQGQALLSDFGIAVVLDAAMTQKVDVVGTLPYMAPEQFEGLASPLSDQYALGCMAYELVTGRRPIIAESSQWIEWALKHRQHVPVPPSQCSAKLPVAMDRVILKALAKNRAERFATVEEFVVALQTAMSEPTSVQQPVAAAQTVILPSPVPTAPPRREPDPQVLLESAYRLYSSRRYEEALNLFEQVIAREPSNATAYYGKGIILFDQQRYISAIEAFEQAIVRAPTFARAYLGKGDTLFTMHAFRRALDAYEHAIQHDPGEISAYYGKAEALEKLKRPVEAHVAYVEALDRDTTGENDERKGDAFCFLGRYDEALAVYDWLSQHEPDNPEFLECRGNILRKLGRSGEAKQMYARASELRGYV